MSRRKAVPPPIGMQHRCGAPLRLTGCACCGGPVWDCSVCVPTELRDRDGEPHRTVVPVRCPACVKAHCRTTRPRCGPPGVEPAPTPPPTKGTG